MLQIIGLLDMVDPASLDSFEDMYVVRQFASSFGR